MDGSNHIDTELRSLVERIREKHEERDEKTGDIRELYAEAKEAGFVVGMVRQMVKEARMDADARNSKYQQEEEYRAKLGLLAQIGPLGEAAVEREAAYDAANRAHPLPVSEMPRPFAEQPVHAPKRRGRPRKTTTEEHLANARMHLGFEIIDGNA